VAPCCASVAAAGLTTLTGEAWAIARENRRRLASAEEANKPAANNTRETDSDKKKFTISNEQSKGIAGGSRRGINAIARDLHRGQADGGLKTPDMQTLISLARPTLNFTRSKREPV
jgi:hypothetical protein